MTESASQNWRQRCRELGLDPQEVKAVSRRYDMYQSYTETQGGDTLDLPRWYKWYRVEKLSEGHASLAPPVQGCSIDGDAEDPGAGTAAVVSEREFLTLLELYRASAPRR